MSNDARKADQRLFQGYSGRMLIIGVFGSMTITGGQAVISPLLPTIIQDLGISGSEAGLVLTVMAALAGLARYPGGRYSDSLTRKTVMISAFGIMLPGYFVLLGAITYPLLLLGTALAGVGAGLYTPAVAGLLSDLFIERRGQAFGINSALISLGGVLASGVATVALMISTWRSAFLPVILLLSVLLLSKHVWSREGYSLDRPQLALFSTIRRLLYTTRLRQTIVALVLLSIVYRGATGFLPTFLQIDKELAPVVANSAYAGIFVVGMVASPLAGKFGDRWGHAVVAAGTTGLGLVGLTGLLFAESVPLIISSILVFAFGLTAFWPVMNTYVMDVAPDSNMGGDFGAIGTIYIGVGSIGPTYVGVVADNVSYTMAFAGLSICLLVAIPLLIQLSRTE